MTSAIIFGICIFIFNLYFLYQGKEGSHPFIQLAASVVIILIISMQRKEYYRLIYVIVLITFFYELYRFLYLGQLMIAAILT